MRRLGVIATMVLAFGTLLGAAQEAAASGAPDSFADLAAKLTPAVVSITTESFVSNKGTVVPDIPEGSPFADLFRKFFERYGNQDQTPERMPVALGSGFIIDPSGYVVTNYHVIEQADAIIVRLDDGTQLEAKIVGVDTKTDLALLKVKSDKPLPYVSFGDSNAVRVGDWVLAIGNPFGFGNSVTAGIISARQRDIRSGPYDEFLQTDAPINRGNSGGPLFNMAGKVIGVNTAIYSPSGGSVGIGFAVPSSLVSRVISQLRKYGHTKRGWLGVRIQSVTPEIAKALGLDKPEGALVASVTPGGPAEKAGLQAGDVIITFNGKPIHDMRELPRVVADSNVGQTVKVVVLRKGERKSVEVKLGELEAFESQLSQQEPAQGNAPASTATEQFAGMTLAPYSADLAKQYGLAQSGKGLIVTKVAEASPAAKEDIKPGDVLLQIGDTPVASVDDVRNAVEKATQQDPASVLVLVKHGGNAQFHALQLGG